MVTVDFNDLENAFFFVGSAQMYENSAYLNRESGEFYYKSEMGDFDELPEDIYDNAKYVNIPHKNELDLGKNLVLDFTSTHMPDEIDEIFSIFRKKGAYSKFRNMLEDKGLLETWYAFEGKHHEEALREWCKENNIRTTS